jgi:hypothetical protein
VRFFYIAPHFSEALINFPWLFFSPCPYAGQFLLILKFTDLSFLVNLNLLHSRYLFSFQILHFLVLEIVSDISHTHSFHFSLFIWKDSISFSSLTIFIIASKTISLLNPTSATSGESVSLHCILFLYLCVLCVLFY